MSSTENRCYTLTKRALIVHALFDVIGGGELLALRVAQALTEAGFEVEVLTSTPVSSEKLYNVFGELKLPRITVKSVREAEFLSEIMPGRLVRLRRLVVYRKYMPIINRARREYDLVFDTQSNVPLPADIVYIHYPAVLEITSIKRKGIQWRIYNYLVKQLAGKFRPGRIFAN